MSNIFDDDEIFEIKNERQVPSPNNCDIYDPSVYVPDNSKQRAEYIKSITAKIKLLIDTALLNTECPEDEEPTIDLETFGKDPDKTFKLIFKYLKGERGYNGSVDNFVVMSSSEYENLRVKDPNKFYFTWEDESSSESYIENNILHTNGTISNNKLTINGNINNNILNL